MDFCLQSPDSDVENIELALVLGKECGGKACVAKPEGGKVLQGGLHCTPLLLLLQGLTKGAALLPPPAPPPAAPARSPERSYKG